MQKSLRPRTIGQFLDGIYHQYRKFFLQLLIISLLFELPQLVLSSFFQTNTSQPNWQLLGQGKTGIIHFFSQMQNYPAAHGGIILAVLSFLVSMLTLNIFSPLLNSSYYSLANIALSVGLDQTQKLPTREIIRRAIKRWPAFLSTLWLLIGLTVSAMIVTIVLFIVITLLGGLSLQILQLPVSLILIGLFIWIFIRLQFTFIVVVIEEVSNWRAIKRSWDLTSGNFWRIFTILSLGQLVLSFATMGFISIIPSIPGTGIQTALGWIFSLIIEPLYSLLLVNIFWDIKTMKDSNP